MCVSKQLSFLVCLLLFTGDVHAMWNACARVVAVDASFARTNPSSARGAVPHLWNMPTALYPSQRTAHHNVNVFQRRAYAAHDEIPSNDNALIEEVWRVICDRGVLLAADEATQEDNQHYVPEVACEEDVMFFQEQIVQIFGDNDVASTVEVLRTRILLNRQLVNVLGHVDLRRLATIDFEDDTQAFIVRVMIRRFPYPTVGYSLLNEALRSFAEAPGAFLADLARRQVNEGELLYGQLD